MVPGNLPLVHQQAVSEVELEPEHVTVVHVTEQAVYSLKRRQAEERPVPPGTEMVIDIKVSHERPLCSKNTLKIQESSGHFRNESALGHASFESTGNRLESSDR